MSSTLRKSPNRRGAALIIALVLLVFIGAIASAALPQILRDRQEVRMEWVRQQAQLLLGDALLSAETQRQSDPDFSGETFSLGPDYQSFGGTFHVTTKYQEDQFTATVEYCNAKGKTLYFVKRSLQPHPQP